MRSKLTCAGAIVAALAVTAGTAAAETGLPAAKALLGGGSLGEAYGAGGKHFDLQFVTARVSDDGKKVHFYGDLNARCSGVKGAVTGNFDVEVPLAADGTFGGTGTIPKQARAKDLKYAFEGRFSGATAASGTASVGFTFLSGDASYRCSSGTVAWQARTSPDAAGSAPSPAAGAIYAGNNDETYPFVLRIAKDGSKVAQLGTELELKCSGRKDPLFYSVVAPAGAIQDDGSFVSTEAWQMNPALFGSAVEARASQKVTGTFGDGSATGGWRIDVVLRNAKTGKKAGSCTTGAITWAASR
jgi:hypothetical protein